MDGDAMRRVEHVRLCLSDAGDRKQCTGSIELKGLFTIFDQVYVLPCSCLQTRALRAIERKRPTGTLGLSLLLVGPDKEVLGLLSM